MQNSSQIIVPYVFNYQLTKCATKSMKRHENIQQSSDAVESLLMALGISNAKNSSSSISHARLHSMVDYRIVTTKDYKNYFFNNCDYLAIRHVHTDCETIWKRKLIINTNSSIRAPKLTSFLTSDFELY